MEGFNALQGLQVVVGVAGLGVLVGVVLGAMAALEHWLGEGVSFLLVALCLVFFLGGLL